MIFEHLRQFRQILYSCFGASKDALFELMDAALMSPSLRSFVCLSQHPIFRRQWSSTIKYRQSMTQGQYSACQDSSILDNQP